MVEFSFASLSQMAPELFIAVSALALLVIGVLRGHSSTGFVSRACMVVFFVAFILMASNMPDGEPILNGMFVQDNFTFFMKALIMAGIVTCLGLATQYFREENAQKFEYPLLVTFAGLGMLLMVSANNMLSLYVGLELQSLSLYVLAAIRRNQLRSAESGMKYFVLGAISSGMLLFGISLVYGFTGSIDFNVIGTTLANDVSLGAVLGFVFLFAGLAFKISAAPFHMWTPDVYEGAPMPVTALFALVPKIAAIALIIRLLFIPFEGIADQWFQMVWFLSFASMMVGAFAALRQDNIKRLLAYSSIGNMGYVLIGIAAGNDAGLASVLVYLALYMVMTAGTFALILCMRRDGKQVETISEMAGMSRHAPWLAYPLAILMFSMSGIPPMAGFFGKFMVFQAAMQTELYILGVLGILSSVVAAYYYLRIIKVMFFDEPVEKFDGGVSYTRKIIISVSIAVILFFIFKPSPLIEASQRAVLGFFY